MCLTLLLRAGKRGENHGDGEIPSTILAQLKVQNRPTFGGWGFPIPAKIPAFSPYPKQANLLYLLLLLLERKTNGELGKK
jgi:hypothetical protein